MGKSFIRKDPNTLIVDYTNRGNFKEFNDRVKKLIIRNKNKKNICVADYIYPFDSDWLKNTYYEISDHVNLSGINPLKGPNFTFTPLTNIYSSKDGIRVAGLPKGIILSKTEENILKKINIKASCFNTIPTVIFAASLGLKIKAFGIVQE